MVGYRFNTALCPACKYVVVVFNITVYNFRIQSSRAAASEIAKKATLLTTGPVLVNMIYVENSSGPHAHKTTSTNYIFSAKLEASDGCSSTELAVGKEGGRKGGRAQVTIMTLIKVARWGCFFVCLFLLFGG